MKQTNRKSPRNGDYDTIHLLHPACGDRLAALYPKLGESLTALQPAEEPDEEMSR